LQQASDTALGSVVDSTQIEIEIEAGCVLTEFFDPCASRVQ
jgi:hypothetical protein